MTEPRPLPAGCSGSSALKRLDTRIQAKRDEIKELEEQKRQVEQAISALNNE
jgi:hypothetical protein